ncbi:AAA family ATPase [Streptomyces sp. NPDC007084]|uniref:AAA family ATPase n=1 Tax=Streptomyces sp. NPDC007084 TaxID=3154313 RepID=UPI0034541BED
MLEVVALSALTAFFTNMVNGAGNEMGKQLLVSTGALVRRTTGRPTPLPAGAEEQAALAGVVHTRMSQDPRVAGEWASLMGVHQQGASRTLAGGGGLPPAPRHFTNRQKVLKALAREATRPADGRPRVALLYGPPGIGTTATALHLGAAHHDRFPDGQFYIDLRDAAADSGLQPAAVLQRLLRQMGVTAEQMPPSTAGREQLYRQLSAGRHALIVIDHATSLAQVRSLIPSTPGVFLLVVVSGQPFALDAQRVEVQPLSDHYAKQMVRDVAGKERYARAKARIPHLLDQCAGNAFALRAAATRLDADDDDTAGQTAPAEGHHPVRSAARHAVDGLPEPTARLCRLSALGGWPSLDAHLAAAAADVELDDAARMLAEAADVQLLEPVGDERYRFRPEVRRYLADTAGPEHGIAECAAAVTRSLNAELLRALHAAHAALPQSWRTEPRPDEGTPHADEAEGLAVLAAEKANIVRAVTLAQEYQHIPTALRLARALWPLQLKAGHFDEVLPALRVAVRCADAHQPLTGMAGALHFQLAHCLSQLQRADEADREALAAVHCERAARHVRGEASAVELQGLLLLYRWEFRAAYERFTEAERLYGQISSGQEGAADLPRARALAARHQGRALRGMGRLDEAERLLRGAVDFFREQGEAYNTARVLTDLAETLHDGGENRQALAHISEAEHLLTPAAAPHLEYLGDLRRRCEAAR